jgi:cellulose synthase/poly-beta-1,6-N-acetylglucosamine synthase-like glycosyltransferase
VTRRQRWRIIAPLGVCAFLTLWIALSAANAKAAGYSMLVYAAANLIVYTDAIDFVLRLFMRRRHRATMIATADIGDLSLDIVGALPEGVRQLVPVRPYAIIASVYNLQSQLEQFMQAWAPWRDRIWLISDGSTDRTVARLRQAGWRCFDDGVNRKKPGAIRRLLETLPPHIETVMVIDPDIRIRGRNEGSTIDLEHAISDFQRSGAAAVCPRIMIDPDGFLARFQAFEYALAFRVGRASLANYSITSGVSIYRRDALEAALAQHSMSVYAEDYENAMILLSRGETIYYDGRLVVSTEGPGKITRWFSQRVGWYHGLVRVYWTRFPEVWRVSRRSPFAFYHFIVYVGGLSLGLHLVKMVSATLLVISLFSGLDQLLVSRLLPQSSLTNPGYFVSAVGSYLALGVVALFTVVPKAERAYAAPIVPLYLFYALVHIVPMTIGFVNWVTLQFLGRRVYRDHYESDASLRARREASRSIPEKAA